MDMLVWDDLPLQFGWAVMVGIAAEPVLHPALDECVWQDPLDRAALDLAGRERMAGDDRRSLAEHGCDVVGREIAAVELAEIRELSLPGGAKPVTEIVLTAGVP